MIKLQFRTGVLLSKSFIYTSCNGFLENNFFVATTFSFKGQIKSYITDLVHTDSARLYLQTKRDKLQKLYLPQESSSRHTTSLTDSSREDDE